MKICAVYNSMGLGQENIVYYVDAIRSLLYQKGVNIKIALSACMPTHMWLIQSTNTFGPAISYNFVHENVPVSVTFNDTVEKMVKHYGNFDGYLYIDSGISFWDPGLRYDALSRLVSVYEAGPYAITAAMPSNDDGRQWWGINYPDEGDYVFPIGKTTNMHCQIFSEDWRVAYGRVLPDIFASHCMESVFSHMCGAIRKRFILTQSVHLLHNHSMDGASIGTRSTNLDRYPMSSTFETGGQFFKTQRKVDEMYREGKQLGFGIEECKEYWPHDPDCYEDGYAKNPLLKTFLRENLYLTKEEFDYGSLKSQFHPGE